MLRIDTIKKQMHPELFKKWELFDKKMKEVGLAYAITSVARTVLDQMALFVQGRLPIDIVNLFRYEAGMKKLPENENKKVTWTLKSKHITNFFDKDLSNDFSQAWDIALLKDNKVYYDIKVSVNSNVEADYDEAGRIGKEIGLIWGGDFKSPDKVHFELKEEIL